MAIPDFVAALRERLGTLPLWLVGVTAVVVRESNTGIEVLMVKRADNGAWTPVTGIVDPGEHPELAAVRETLEESAVTAEVVQLAQVGVTGEVVYPNGDRTQYLDLTYRCRPLPDSADPAPLDGENVAARWHPVTGLNDLEPAVTTAMRGRIDAALSGEARPRTVLLETPGPDPSSGGRAD